MNVETFIAELQKLEFEEYPGNYHVTILFPNREFNLDGVVLDESRKKLYFYIGSVAAKE